MGKDWGQPPSSTKVDDTEILKLANKPLHALRLADLVAYASQKDLYRKITNGSVVMVAPL